MHDHRSLPAIAILALGSLAACKAPATDAQTETSVTVSPSGVSAGSPYAPGAAVGVANGQKSVEVKSAPPPPASAPAPKSPGTATISNGKKELKTNGNNLDLENESGKGSISTSGGKTTITGKSGKSVTIPLP